MFESLIKQTEFGIYFASTEIHFCKLMMNISKWKSLYNFIPLFIESQKFTIFFVLNKIEHALCTKLRIVNSFVYISFCSIQYILIVLVVSQKEITSEIIAFQILNF